MWHDYETEGAGYNVNNDACGSGATYACYSVYDSSSFTDVILYGCASGSKNFYICDETASPTSQPTDSPSPAVVVSGELMLQTTPCTNSFSSAITCEGALTSTYSGSFTYNGVSHSEEWMAGDNGWLYHWCNR